MPSASREHIARDAADALDSARASVRDIRLFVGFDAVIDSVIDVVDSREGAGYTRISGIGALAERIAAAAGKSTNLEFVVKRRKVGGNAAILADCASRLSASVNLVATIGDESDPSRVHAVFHDLAARCRSAASLGPPAATDALEFDDGKVMLGKTEALDAITWDSVMRSLGGASEARALFGQCDALVTANWTMTSSMTDIWRRLRTMLATPETPAAPAPGRLFVDMADPAKRTDEDVRDAIEALVALDAHVPVALGLNLAEAERLSRSCAVRAVSGVAIDDKDALANLAHAIRDSLGIHVVLVHTRHCSACADGDATASIMSPFVRRPTISTGAGDHFNAGWLLADRLKLPVEQCLAVASAVSGWYVRKGESPTLSDVVAFLRDLPAPEPL